MAPTVAPAETGRGRPIAAREGLRIDGEVLDLEAEPAPNLGRDRFGRNVYATPADPGYAVLAGWARGEP